MRKMLTALLIGGCFYSIFATDARVSAMGRYDNFFMDDISIFKNPANINVYPNMFFGNLGTYMLDSALDPTGQLAGLQPYNRDPQKPYFGGILSYSLNQSTDAGNQYPMLSFGLSLNRYDKMLGYITPGSKDFIGNKLDVQYLDTNIYSMKWARPVGKVDIMIGYALKNGGMIGIGGYLAFQKITEKEIVKQESKIMRGNIGVNLPVAKTIDLEISASGGLLSDIGTLIDTSKKEIKKITLADNDLFFNADLRLFSAMANINGDFVPHAAMSLVKYRSGENYSLSINGGFAVNVNIDRGFFWTGIEGVYEAQDAKYIGPNDTRYSVATRNTYQENDKVGARISFGIERNIIWDWFVIRAGGTKLLAFERTGGVNGVMQWIENSEANANDDDLVSIGVGVNVENRFKVDVVVAENLFYTWSNLVSGNAHHIFTLLSATFSF